MSQELLIYPIILNSDSYYCYVTYLLSPSSIARHHIRHKKLVVYFYKEDIVIDSTGQWVIGCRKEEEGEIAFKEGKHPSLLKVALYEVIPISTSPNSYIFEYIDGPCSLLNSILERARKFEYVVHQVQASPLYKEEEKNRFLLDSHWLVSQHRAPKTTQEVHFLRLMAIDRFVLLLNHTPTNTYHQMLIQERIPKLFVSLSPISFPPQLEKFQILCRGKLASKEKHPIYHRLEDTHRCRILNCCCSGLGQTAVCTTCNLLYHTCIYTGCYECVSVVYEEAGDLQRRLVNHEERVSSRIQSKLQKHISKRHQGPKTPLSSLIKRDLTLVPDLLRPLDNLTSSLVLGELLGGLGVGVGLE
jgi:hypothetical protein